MLTTRRCRSPLVMTNDPNRIQKNSRTQQEQIHLWMRPRECEWLRSEAKRRGMTISALIREGLILLGLPTKTPSSHRRKIEHFAEWKLVNEDVPEPIASGGEDSAASPMCSCTYADIGTFEVMRVTCQWKRNLSCCDGKRVQGGVPTTFTSQKKLVTIGPSPHRTIVVPGRTSADGCTCFPPAR